MKFGSMKDTQVSGFELLPKGRYDFIITGAEEKTSTKGNQYIRLELTCVNENTDEVKSKNRKVWANINQNDIGQSQMKEILVANDSSLSEAEDSIEITEDLLIGMRVSGMVGTETYNDSTRNNVKYFKAIDERYKDITIEDIKAETSTSTFVPKDTYEAPSQKNPFARS